MTTLTPLGKEAAEQQEIALFDMAYQTLARIALVLNAHANRLEAGDHDDLRGAMTSMVELRKAAQTAMDERKKVADIRKQAGGAGDSGALALDAARDEVERRLACLRGDRDADDVS